MSLEGPEMLEAFLSNLRSGSTRAAYRSDLLDFERFLNDEAAPGSLDAFVRLPEEEVQPLVQDYLRTLARRGVSPSTMNRRLSSLRSLVSFTHRHGNASCERLRVQGPGRPSASAPAAPGLSALQLRCLLSLPQSTTLPGARDAAILRLLCENGLRPRDLCAAKVADFSPEKQTLRVAPEHGLPRIIALSDRCARVLEDYLGYEEHRAAEEAPLIRSLDHRPGRRAAALTDKGLRHILSGYGRQLGIALSPSVLRATAISLAAERTGGAPTAIRMALDGLPDYCGVGSLPAGSQPGITQSEITDLLSDLLSDPRLIRADAERLRRKSARLREKSGDLKSRSDSLMKRSMDLQRKLEDLAVRCSRFQGATHARGHGQRNLSGTPHDL